MSDDEPKVRDGVEAAVNRALLASIVSRVGEPRAAPRASRTAMTELLTLQRDKSLRRVDQVSSVATTTVEALIAADCRMVGRRLGDLRLECLVGMESGLISNHRASLLDALASLFDGPQRCERPEPRYLFFADRALWSVTLVHERRIAWRGTQRTGSSSGSFSRRLTLPDWPGRDTVSVRALGPSGEVCRASVAIAES